MQYLLLIYTEERDGDWDMQDPAVQETMAAYDRFNEAVEQAGVLRGSNALQPTGTATSVRVRDGETLTTDGPFAETKEVFGGYYLLDCADLDEAIRWAARIPGAATGTVEIRPIVEFPG